MAGINKVIIELYSQGLSIPQISDKTEVSRSTIRSRLKSAGILRCRVEAIRMAASDGRLGSGNRGKKRVFSEEWKSNISKAKLAQSIGKGFSLKPNGYIEITVGKNKGRSQHVIIMETEIGRRLNSNECVHHIDHVKNNNEISNLQLMTRGNHMRLHATENIVNRERNNLGRFI